MRYLYLRIKIFKDIENVILIEIYENFGGGLLVKIFTEGTVDCPLQAKLLQSTVGSRLPLWTVDCSCEEIVPEKNCSITSRLLTLDSRLLRQIQLKI